MKKIVGIVLLLLVFVSMVCGAVAAEASPGPSLYSGDGIPSGNQFIRPDNLGVGPAPNSSDSIPDGVGLTNKPLIFY